MTYKQRVEQKYDEGCDGTGVQEVDPASGKMTYFYNGTEDDGTDNGGRHAGKKGVEPQHQDDYNGNDDTHSWNITQGTQEDVKQEVDGRQMKSG